MLRQVVVTVWAAEHTPPRLQHIITDVPTVFNKPGQLSAGLGIKVCGVWYGWGCGGSPRLLLP